MAHLALALWGPFQVRQWLRIVSMSKPLLLAIDDLQWADGGTVAFDRTGYHIPP